MRWSLCLLDSATFPFPRTAHPFYITFAHPRPPLSPTWLVPEEVIKAHAAHLVGCACHVDDAHWPGSVKGGEQGCSVAGAA